jgi:hypothetical protein
MYETPHTRCERCPADILRAGHVHRVMYSHRSPCGHQRGHVHDGIRVPHRLGQRLRLADVSQVHGDVSLA